MKQLLLITALAVSIPAFGWTDTARLTANAEPQRVIQLPAGARADEWARQNGLDQWRAQRDSSGRPYLTTRLEEDRWQNVQRECHGAACVSDSCQGVRTLNLPPERQGWLVPRAPDLERTLNRLSTACPADLETQLWQGEWPTDSDPACWQLQLSQPCQTEQTPGEYLKEQWRPNQVVLMVERSAETGTELAYRLGMQLLDETLLKSTGHRLVQLQRSDSSPQLEPLLEQLRTDPGLSLVQKDLAYFTLANAADPLAGFNYGPRLSTADRLMPEFSGLSINVAVIDTGIDLQHPELTDVLALQQDFTGRGYSADAHGTAVAAIIAGARNNGVGASGVAPGVQLSSFKACHPRETGGLDARCWSSSLIKALDEAISLDVPVINLSLGGPPSPILKRLVEEAEKRGLLLVSAAGNGGPNARPVYPAAWPEAVAVTAIGPDKQLYKMANQGAYIQLAAPGVDIITAGPGSAQPILSGTSMASAHLSGIAAQLKQMAPDSSGAQLKTLLMQSGEDLGQFGTDTLYGAGLVNACRSAAGLAELPERCADQVKAEGGE